MRTLTTEFGRVARSRLVSPWVTVSLRHLFCYLFTASPTLFMRLHFPTLLYPFPFSLSSSLFFTSPPPLLSFSLYIPIIQALIMSPANSDSESKSESTPPPTRRKPSKDVPAQQSIDKFWKKFTTKNPGKLFTVLPHNRYAQRAVIEASRKAGTLNNAVASYEEAAKTCKAKVEKIARDCRRLNQKYKDAHFDIEFDFMSWQYCRRTEDCLVALSEDHTHLRPMSVKRIEVC